jgi:biotin synthase
MELNEQAQAWCFFAGANSLFYGDKLLTTENPEADTDLQLFAKLGLNMQKVAKVHAGDHDHDHDHQHTA